MPGNRPTSLTAEQETRLWLRVVGTNRNYIYWNEKEQTFRGHVSPQEALKRSLKANPRLMPPTAEALDKMLADAPSASADQPSSSIDPLLAQQGLLETIDVPSSPMVVSTPGATPREQEMADPVSASSVDSTPSPVSHPPSSQPLLSLLASLSRCLLPGQFEHQELQKLSRFIAQSQKKTAASISKLGALVIEGNSEVRGDITIVDSHVANERKMQAEFLERAEAQLDADMQAHIAELQTAAQTKKLAREQAEAREQEKREHRAAKTQSDATRHAELQASIGAAKESADIAVETAVSSVGELTPDALAAQAERLVELPREVANTIEERRAVKQQLQYFLEEPPTPEEYAEARAKVGAARAPAAGLRAPARAPARTRAPAPAPVRTPSECKQPERRSARR